MRTLLLTIGSLLIAITAAIGFGKPSETPPLPEGRWVRTVDGWVSRDSLLPSRPRPFSLHPAVVAGVQITASLAVMSLASQLAAPRPKA